MNNNIISIHDETSKEKIQLIRETICKGCTDSEIQLFSYVCKRTGLDPFMRQIHPVKRKNKQPDGSYKEIMTIQTGIDGYRLIAERTNKYSPGKEPTYQYDSNGNILSSTAYVKKQTSDGTWHDVSATAFWNEYVQKGFDGKPSKFWSQMPHGQISKCAEALALRKAFPAELSGIYTKDEMQQAENDSPDPNLENIKIEPINEITAEVENKNLLEFLATHPVEEQELIESYVKKYCSHWKKTITDSINEFQADMDKFNNDLAKWKIKQDKVKLAVAQQG